jgi:hypothetical protein
MRRILWMLTILALSEKYTVSLRYFQHILTPSRRQTPLSGVDNNGEMQPSRMGVERAALLRHRTYA